MSKKALNSGPRLNPSGYAHGILAGNAVYLGGQTALTAIWKSFPEALWSSSALWREMAGSENPAMAGIGVARLWQERAMIKIQGIAVVQDRP